MRGWKYGDVGQIWVFLKENFKNFYQKGRKKMVERSKNPSALGINWLKEINCLN